MTSSSTKFHFIKNNLCVNEAFNPTDKTCFCRCMVMGLAKLNKLEGKEYKKLKNHAQHDHNRMLKQTAKDMRKSLNISVFEDMPEFISFTETHLR